MITVKEAYKIAKKSNNKLNCTTYCDFRGKYMFCYGDPDYYITVDKNTGELGEIQVMTAMLGPMYFGTANEKEHEQYCNELEQAINNYKTIS